MQPIREYTAAYQAMILQFPSSESRSSVRSGVCELFHRMLSVTCTNRGHVSAGRCAAHHGDYETTGQHSFTGGEALTAPTKFSKMGKSYEQAFESV
jgi:hypothetical protein